MKTAFPLVYVSSSCFPYQNLNDLLIFCKNNKFTNLELTGSLAYDENALTILKKHADDFHFLIHNYFPQIKDPLVINLASNNAAIREKSLNHCQQALELCQTINAPFYSVHAGFLVDLDPDDLGAKQTSRPRIDRAAGLKNFTDSISQLLTETRVNLLVENNVNSQENLVEGKNELYLLAEPEETLVFFRRFNHPRLGLLVDLGHLNVSAKQLKFDKDKYLETLRPWIRAFHLSANDGISDQGRRFTKDEWFIKKLKEFPETPKIIEISSRSQAADLRNCFEAVVNL